MATKTTTETKREITKKGDVIIIKTLEKTTTYSPGKEPVVKETVTTEEYKGEEGFKKLPADVRSQLIQSTDPKNLPEIPRPPPSPVKENFVAECLAEHNKYRNKHGVLPLKLNKELMDIAAKRAQELADCDKLTKKSDMSYGENVSCSWSSDPNHTVQASDIVEKWYKEEKGYDYNKEPSNSNAGQFTQMVWKNTSEFGVAAAKSKSNKIFVVAAYRPPGNFVGEFKKNVFSPSEFNISSTSNYVKAKPSSQSPQSPPAQNQSKEKGVAREKSVKFEDKARSEGLNLEGLSCHNEYRKKHGVPLLKISSKLIQYAQEWADNLAREDKLEHRTERVYGENLYCFKSSNPQIVTSASEACRSWYSEIEQYDFDSEPTSLATGHFTQMIWKGTKEVGMAYSKSKTGLQIIVANYNPPGNFIGKFRENIPKPLQ